MEFQFFDSSDCDFPKPKVPVLPPLTRHSLSLRLVKKPSAKGPPDGTFAALSKSTHARHYARGRYALFEAYRLAGVGKSGALLAPSYHCGTMLDPALRLGAAVAFYPLNADLSPDIQAITAQLKSQQAPIKALLATHYFGFPQEFAKLAAICAQHGITLIEDCSHALFAPLDAAERSTKVAIGETGQIGIASPYKFYPSEDGGFLWINDALALSLGSQRAAGLGAEIKGAMAALTRYRANRLGLSRCDVGDEIKALALQNKALGRNIRRPGDSHSIFYQPAEEGQRSLALSRWIFRHTHVARLASSRRQNYRRWVDAVADLPVCQALLPTLPPDCVPYMFPLLIDCPTQHFHLLKRLGLPVWRWDTMAVSECAVAAKYRLNLLHLPCHQELSPAQMNWMVQAVRQVLSSS